MNAAAGQAAALNNTEKASDAVMRRLAEFYGFLDPGTPLLTTIKPFRTPSWPSAGCCIPCGGTLFPKWVSGHRRNPNYN